MILSNADIKALCSSFGVDEHDAFLLLQNILGIKYSFLILSKEIEISKKQFNDFKSTLKMRARRVPIAKIIGYKAFYNHDFITSIHTLDPRPETELIVDLVQKYIKDKLAELSILDLGCGTGCIGLSLIDLYPNANLLLSDISKKALAIAKKNASNLALDERCSYVQSNWFSNITKKFDIIVCNPPYISDDYNLDNDTLWDPHTALFGGKDGLDAYRNILPKVHKFLIQNGMLFLELGIGQMENVCAMTSTMQLLEVAKDLQDINRTAVFKFTNQPVR